LNPYILGVADTIDSDISNYNNLTNEEKYYSLLSHSINGLFTFLGTNQEKVSKLITDFVSIEAASLGRDGYGQTVRDANELGFTGIQCHVADLGGASVGGALGEAHRISVSNPYAVVLVAGADVPKSAFKQISDLKRLTKTVAHPIYEIDYGATLIGMYALLANIQMQENNISLDDYIEITKKFRENAIDNPRALNYSKEILDKQISKPLAYPYSTPMIAIVTDHGFATLIVGNKVYDKFVKESGIRNDLSKLFIFGSGHSIHSEYFTLKGKLESPSALAAERAFASSNLTRKDVDYAWIYDCFIGMIIAQSSEYFGENPKKVADALKKGKIPNGNREIPINLGGGILNYQAAMAISGAAGLVDVLSQYNLAKNRIPRTLDFQPKVSLLGGNGGIDSINSVLLFGIDPNHKSEVQETKIHRRLSLNPIQNYYNSDSKKEIKATLLSHTVIQFNPGGEKKPPYVLALALLENGDFIMVNLYDKNNNEIKSVDGLKNSKTSLLLKKDGSIWKGIIDN
jgi:acetyl-CoA acyltransferase